MQGTKIRAGIDPEVVAKELTQPIERQQRLRVVAARGECSHPQRVPAFPVRRDQLLAMAEVVD